MAVTRAEERASAHRHHQTPLGHPCPAAAGGGGGLECDALAIPGACKKRREEVGLGQTRRSFPRLHLRLRPFRVRRSSSFIPSARE